MKNMQKTMLLSGISFLLMGIIVAPGAFFYARSIEPVEVATYQAGEEIQVVGTADYTTYRTADHTISCQTEAGDNIDLFQERDTDIAFTSDDFLTRSNITCSSEITAFTETSPAALRLTGGLLIASPVFIGIGIWFIRKNRKSNHSN